jgi:precorrin-6B methylase 2
MRKTELSTPKQLFELARNFMSSRVLFTAYELGVFTALGRRPLASGAVARRLNTDPRATDRLLNALVVLGLLRKRGQRFADTPLGRRHLVRGAPGYLGGLGHLAGMWRTWSDLSASVRRGRSAPRAPVNRRGRKWLEAFIAAMHGFARSRAPRLARALDLRGARRMLDVGGGSGAYAMACARAAPALKAVVFDLPNVLPLTRSYIRREGLAARVKTLAGDYLRNRFPKGQDLVLLSEIVHQNSPAQNAALIRKCAQALNPGGQLVVKDKIVDESRTRPASAALFALNMLTATPAGDVYTQSELRAWFIRAGLTRMERRDLPEETGLLIGWKARKRDRR